MRPVAILLIIAASTLGVAAPADALAPAHDWHSEVATAQAEAEASGRFILVDLYADWCGWCKKLEREVFSDPAFVEFAQPFVKLRVDVEDRGEGEELQARYRAGGLPTLLVLSPRMALAGMVEGYAPRDAYIRRISDVVEGYRREVESYDRLLETDDPRVLKDVAEQLHGRGDGARAARAYRRLLDEPGLDPEERPRFLYLLADAYRLDQDFEKSTQALKEAKRWAQKAGNRELIEASDLLLIRLAQDRGGCADLIAALEQFLSDHPRSRHHPMARRSLDALARSPDPTCT